MSFMFNPHPYNKKGAINRPEISDKMVGTLKKGNMAIVDELAKDSSNKVIAFDGYTSADFSALVNMLAGKFKSDGVQYEVIEMDRCFNQKYVDDFTDNLVKIREIQANIAKEKNLILIDTLSKMQENVFYSDGCHLTDKGY